MFQAFFNPQITLCPGSKYPAKCTPVAWGDVVEDLRNGKWKDYAEKCAAIPESRRQDWKRRNAPLVVIGANLRYRNTDPGNLIAHSGLICLDLDGVDDSNGLKQAISGLSFVSLVCKSISGTGLFCAVRIPPCDADTHKRYYNALQDLFAERFNTTTTIDAAPKSIASARYVSYDPDLYYNPNPVVFDELPPAVGRLRQQPSRESVVLNDEPSRRKVLRLANDAISHRLDITSDYDNLISGYNDWLCIAGTLAGLFGEAARDIFHRLSSLSPSYSERKTDHKFTEALKKRFTPRIGAFINICKKYGLDTSNHYGENDIPVIRRLTPADDFKDVTPADYQDPAEGIQIYHTKPIQWSKTCVPAYPLRVMAGGRPDSGYWEVMNRQANEIFQIERDGIVLPDCVRSLVQKFSDNGIAFDITVEENNTLKINIAM